MSIYHCQPDILFRLSTLSMKVAFNPKKIFCHTSSIMDDNGVLKSVLEFNCLSVSIMYMGLVWN